MVQTVNQRIAANIEGDFVVFLIGARVNYWYKFFQFIPIARAMNRMIQELQDQPEMGLLHVEQWGGNPSIMVQYWRSFERFGSNGDVGIWHETYLVKAEQYEAIYNNMPEFGLAKAGGWVPASGKQKTAKGRLKLSDGSDEPTYEQEPA